MTLSLDDATYLPEVAPLWDACRASRGNAAVAHPDGRSGEPGSGGSLR